MGSYAWCLSVGALLNLSSADAGPVPSTASRVSVEITQVWWSTQRPQPVVSARTSPAPPAPAPRAPARPVQALCRPLLRRLHRWSLRLALSRVTGAFGARTVHVSLECRLMRSATSASRPGTGAVLIRFQHTVDSLARARLRKVEAANALVRMLCAQPGDRVSFIPMSLSSPHCMNI